MAELTPLRQRIAKLEEALPTALVHRRRAFLIACSFHELTLRRKGSDPETVLTDEEKGLLDQALDHLAKTSRLVEDITHELAGKKDAIEIARQRGVKL